MVYWKQSGFLAAIESLVKKRFFKGQRGLWVLVIGVAVSWNGGNLRAASEEFSQREEKVDRAFGSETKAPTRKAHRIEIGDRLRIKIYPEDQYIKGGDTEVSSEGTITLPLLGKIYVQGMPLTDAEKEITRLLAQDYLVNPVVVIELLTVVGAEGGATISVLGQVKKPGPVQYPMNQKLTLLKVISLAGGFTEIANAKKIKVVRKTGGKTTLIHANAEAIISGKDPDIEMEPDDIVHVGESFF